MNIYLVGYRGVGKTTLAPLVADRLGDPWQVVDLDRQIEAAAGTSVADLFAHRGEPAFRDLETVQLTAIAEETHRVVATGGGVVIRPENRELLKHGWVVWLRCAPETVAGRLDEAARAGRGRPALTSLPPTTEIRQLLQAREPFYREVASYDAATDETAAEDLADQIAIAWLLHAAASGSTV